MKPILFNTEMVRDILNGRKTVTRRVVRGINNTADFLELTENPSVIAVDKHGQEYPKKVEGLYADFVQDGNPEYPLVKAPYRPGDILYVRETWNRKPFRYDEFIYRADGCYGPDMPWLPSIHMPKEAARIFLHVTDVRVERLQSITRDGALKEGANPACAVMNFKKIWDSTLKPKDCALYGWAENPLVWVIEFERITKEETDNG